MTLKEKSKLSQFPGLYLMLVCLFLTVFVPVSAKMIFEITPTANISEEYSDNYLRTSENKQEEFITSYSVGISLGILDTNKQVFINYSPTYRDYKNLSERDRIDHVISMDARFNPTKHTELQAQVHYDGQNDNYQGDRREHRANISGVTQVKKNTKVDYSYNVSRRFDEQLRTGIFKEHTVSTARAGIDHKYGKKDILTAVFIYETDEYEVQDDDEYKKLEPYATASYWFSPLHGMEANLGYLKKDFDLDFNDLETYSGHLRYIRTFSKTLDGYVKYRHSYSDTQDYTHQIYHPSVGVDWEISDDSGISLGVGALFHDWSNENDDNVDPFIDLDAFKRFDFSPRTSLTFTGSSDYTSSGDDASSLGYNTNYRLGAVFSHQLAKRLSSSIFGSYSRVEFNNLDDERDDDRTTLGAGLTWTPLKWLQLGLNYSFTDYRTTSSQRDDYQDNRVYFSIRYVPEKPIRPDKEITRKGFEDKIFTSDNYWKP